MYEKVSDQDRPCSMASATETTGLKCAPEIGPKVRMRATSAAPVANVFASRARARFPLASRSAIIPEPTTVATRIPVPRNSATRRLRRSGFTCFTDPVDFLLDRQFVKTGEGKVQKKGDSPFENHERIAECTFNLLGSSDNCCWIGNTPMRSHGLTRPNRADFFRCVVADGEHKIQARRARPCKLVPVLATQIFGRQSSDL